MSDKISKEGKMVLTIAVIGIIALPVIGLIFLPDKEIEQPCPDKRIHLVLDSLLNEPCPLQEVWFYIQLYNLRHPEVVFAQFIEETGWGTSRIFNEYNNPWGMKRPERRPTTQINRKPSTWGIYHSIEAAVIDMHLWQQSIPQIQYMTQDEYIELLGRIYAPYDTNYTRNIRNLLNRKLE